MAHNYITEGVNLSEYQLSKIQKAIEQGCGTSIRLKNERYQW